LLKLAKLDLDKFGDSGGGGSSAFCLRPTNKVAKRGHFHGLSHLLKVLKKMYLAHKRQSNPSKLFGLKKAEEFYHSYFQSRLDFPP